MILKREEFKNLEIMKTKISLIVFAVVSFLLGMFLPPYDCLQCYVNNIGGLNSASYYEKKAIEEKLAIKKEIHFHFERKNEFVSETLDFSRELRQPGNWHLSVGRGIRH